MRRRGQKMNDAPGSAAGDHSLGSVLAGEHPSRRKAENGLAPFGSRHVEHRRPVNLSGHVDRTVDLPVMRDRFGDHTRYVIFLESISGQGDTIIAATGQKGGRRRGGLSIDVGDSDARAFASEEMGNRTSDVRARSKDDSNFSFESVHDETDAPLSLL